MGLDMYLYAKLRMNKFTEEFLGKMKKVKGIFPEMFDANNLDTITVSFEAGYWRKANHIHQWFVDNVQDGEDDCKAHYLTRGDLENLKKLCEEVLKDNSKASELLPTQEGFFFGDNSYGDFYIKDTEETIEIINKCLQLPEDWDFEYRSSW